ncbi:uncharacterized protein [Linepithema humile]|uniref:uncharacterized protein n=1 Tax=Linepithema humile TaxID=83485 RepID=UPI00351E0C1A
MKAQTRTIFAVCFVIATFKHFGTSVEVSSKIDFDSDENEETLNSTSFDINLNKSANPSESGLRASKLPTMPLRRGSELIKSSEPRKRRIHPSHNHDLAGQPKVINNIQIVVNANDSIPSENSCKHGVCNVSVSSKPDGEGNIVTEVHLSIITNTKPNVKIDDVPVIESFRGINENRVEQPIFYSINTPSAVYAHRSNIPQIQTNYQGYGEPWYQHQRTFQRPHGYWNYRHFEDRDNVGYRGHKTWPRDKPVIDDKIEPPLSKTKPSVNVKS